jgi:ribosomal protein L37AE/L43A
VKLYLSVADGHWVAEIESADDLDPSHQYELSPISVPMNHVINAIKKHYPQYEVIISPIVSENVWFKRHLKLQDKYGLAPVLEDLSDEAEYDDSKTCSICYQEAWYNSSVKKWQCPNCQATESFIDKGRFFTPAKRGLRKRTKEHADGKP